MSQFAAFLQYTLVILGGDFPDADEEDELVEPLDV
jgi:hypothetical protein